MKALAMRIGEEFHDLDDVKFLLRILNLETYQQAIDVITRYYPMERFPQKTLYALQELLECPELPHHGQRVFASTTRPKRRKT